MKQKSEPIEIGKIEIKVSGETLRLTVEQVKELKRVLSQIFPEPVIVAYPAQVHPVIAPTFYYPWNPPHSPSWEIICTGSGDVINSGPQCLTLQSK